MKPDQTPGETTVRNIRLADFSRYSAPVMIMASWAAVAATMVHGGALTRARTDSRTRSPCLPRPPRKMACVGLDSMRKLECSDMVSKEGAEGFPFSQSLTN